VSDGAALTSDGRSVQLTLGMLYHPALNNASQARPASWIQYSEDVVEHPHHGPVAVTRRGMPVQCCAGTGRLARRAETGSSLKPSANVVQPV